jgi:hypothetical protein
MSKPPLPDAAVAMLRKPNPAVITTLRRDGQPVSTASDIDRIARQYTGNSYPQRDRGRFSALIAIDGWHGWGAFKDNSQS